MKKLLPLLLFFISATAIADSPSFTYVELEYIASGDIKVANDDLSVSVDTDGYALTGSLELGMLFLQASRTELTSDRILDSELENSISTFAVGLSMELPQTNIYGLLRARRDELELSGLFNEDESGTSVGVEAGVRFNLTDRLEINGHIGRPSYDEGSSFGVGAQFFVVNNIGITFDYNSIEIEESDIEADIDTASVGVRLSF